MGYTYKAGFPSNVVFGADTVLQAKQHLSPLGNKLLFVMGCGPMTEYATQRINQAFEGEKDFEIQFLDNNDNPINHKSLDIMAEKVAKIGPDVAIAVGGGKTVDIVRAQSLQTHTAVALFPTIAATNACGTRICVIFNDDNSQIADIKVMPGFHQLTLVDTDFVVRAPYRSLVGGIGDCLGSYYEADWNAQQKGRRYTTSSMVWAAFEDSEKILREKGLLAIEACKAGQKTLAFEQVVEHIIVGNGLWSSTAPGGMSLPHVLADEVLVYLGCEHRFLHGELVGYGVLPLFAWAGYPLQRIYDYIDFCLSVGLPTTMDELGIGDVSDDELTRCAEKAMGGWVLRLTDAAITVRDICESMRTSENIVKSYLAGK